MQTLNETSDLPIQVREIEKCLNIIRKLAAIQNPYLIEALHEVVNSLQQHITFIIPKPNFPKPTPVLPGDLSFFYSPLDSMNVGATAGAPPAPEEAEKTIEDFQFGARI